MTSGDSRISSTGKRKLRRGCLWTLIVFGAGMYAGLAATKKALTGPEWARRYAGITLPAPPPVVVSPQNTAPPNNNNPVQQPLANNNAAGNNSAGAGSGGSQSAPPQGANPPNTSANTQPPAAAPTAPQAPPEGGWVVGTWEITDTLTPTGSQASSVTSDYVFEEGGTGEFDTNGKKQFDIHWEDANDYLMITFVSDAEGDQNLKAKLKYSMSPDHNLLTLTPEGKKDMRGLMYNVGPGVYHRKP